MMREVSITEMPGRLVKILSEIELGHRILITRDGAPLAAVVPVHASRRSLEEIERDFEVLRSGCRLESLSICDLRNDGRRV